MNTEAMVDLNKEREIKFPFRNIILVSVVMMDRKGEMLGDREKKGYSRVMTA